MFFKTIFTVLAFAVLSNGLPLEKLSDDMTKFFSPRIVGGNDAPQAYAPHMAALVIGDDFVVLACGGSIVTPILILTAAHCIDIFVVWGKLLPTYHAIVGSNRWDARDNAVQFKDYHFHPKWSWVTIKYDIGFLVLEKPLTLSNTVAVIPVSFERIGCRELCYVAGWGALGTWPLDVVPYQLQLLDVETICHDDCVKGIKATESATGSISPGVDSKIEICTFHSVGHGMCNGDSGSALVLRKYNSQIGIVSWGFPCAIGAPDVFVRMSGFKCYYEKIMSLYS